MYYSTVSPNEAKNLLIPDQDIARLITSFFSQLIITNLKINRIIRNDLMEVSYFENPTLIKQQESNVISLITQYNTSIRIEETKLLSNINELASNLVLYSEQIETINHLAKNAQKNYEYCVNKLISSATEKQNHLQKTISDLEAFLEELRNSLQIITAEFKNIKDKKNEIKDPEKIENLKSRITSIENSSNANNQLVVSNGLLFGKTVQANGNTPQKQLQSQIINIQKNNLTHCFSELKKIDLIEAMTVQYESLLTNLISTIERLIVSNKEIQAGFFTMEVKTLANFKNTKISEKASEIKEIVSTTISFFKTVAEFTLYFMNHVNQEIPNDYTETDLSLLSRDIFERIFLK